MLQVVKKSLLNLDSKLGPSAITADTVSTELPSHIVDLSPLPCIRLNKLSPLETFECPFVVFAFSLPVAIVFAYATNADHDQSAHPNILFMIWSLFG